VDYSFMMVVAMMMLMLMEVEEKQPEATLAVFPLSILA
jgi:hypothetical protein